MNPGRELDAQVAEKVMGLPPAGEIGTSDSWSCERYSTDIASAWTVVERIKDLEPDGSQFPTITGGPPEFTIQYDRRTGLWYAGWQAFDEMTGVGGFSKITARSETAPHAICLVALKSVDAT